MQAQLASLYGCPCPDHLPDLADSLPPEIEASLQLFTARVYKNKQATGKVSTKLIKGYATYLVDGLTKGFGESLDNVDWDTPDAAMLEKLTKNAYHFSAAKTYQQHKALNQALVDDKGKLRSWAAFKAAAAEINGTHVRYLKAEYEMAVASSQMAATWVRAQESKDDLPLLQFDAVMDNRTSAICRPLDGVVRPVDDVFWDTYYPPNHWGCRSDVRSLASGKVTPIETVVPPDLKPAFKTNLAKNGWLFPKDHPYWEGVPPEVPKQAEKLIPYTKKDVDTVLQNSDIEGFVDDPRLQQRFSDEGLKPVEGAMIYDYSEGGFLDLNYYLREGQLDDYHESYAKILNAALDKLPPTPHKLVYRGTKIPGSVLDDYLDHWESGLPYTEKSFVSTSLNADVTTAFIRDGAKDYPVAYEITHKSGRDIQKLSVFQEAEAEVLFKSGTQFKITNMEEFDFDGDKAYRIFMTEVDPDE